MKRLMDWLSAHYTISCLTVGAFTLSKQCQILVSDDAHGTKGFQEWLMDFHGQKINFPQRRFYYTDMEFIGWYVREVFKGNYREL